MGVPKLTVLASRALAQATVSSPVHRDDVWHPPPPSFRTSKLEVDGVVIHSVELGEPTERVKERPPLVLLHGLGDSHRTWRHVAPLLAFDRHVLMPDLAGHGFSARPRASYTLDWHARVMSRWATARGFDEIDVIGHSFGGGVAQMMLLERKPRVRRMILAAAGGFGREVRWLLRLASLPGVVELIGQPFMELGTKLILGGERNAYTEQDIVDACNINRKKGTARAFARTVRGVIGLRGQYRSFYQRGHEIPTLPPIRVLWGTDDDVIPITHAHRFAKAVDGVAVNPLDGCGHYLHRDAPERFAHEVRSFLDAPRQPSVRFVRA